MVVTNIFSKRQKVLRKEVPEVYQCDEIPRPLRVQIVHILRDLSGFPRTYDSNGCLQCFQQINNALCREYGVFGLSLDVTETVDSQVIDFGA